MFPISVTTALLSCPPKISGSTEGTSTNTIISGSPTRFGTERNALSTGQVQHPDDAERDADATGEESDVGPEREVEVQGVQDLEHEHEREERQCFRERLTGRVPADEGREPGSPEGSFELGRSGARPPSPPIEPHGSRDPNEATQAGVISECCGSWGTDAEGTTPIGGATLLRWPSPARSCSSPTPTTPSSSAAGRWPVGFGRGARCTTYASPTGPRARTSRGRRGRRCGRSGNGRCGPRRRSWA